MPAAWLPALQRCFCSISHFYLSNVQLPSHAEPPLCHPSITLESQELTRASRTDSTCSALCNNPHTLTLSVFMVHANVLFRCFPSQPSKQSEVGQQEKTKDAFHKEDIKDDKAPTFQEVVLRAKSPKGCFLLRGTCGPAVCDLTHLTLDVDSSLLCTSAALTVNREKQASPH